MSQDDGSEPFFLPEKKRLREAYKAIIALVLIEKRVLFSPTDLIFGIMDALGLPDDSGIGDKKPGRNYRTAKSILKSFEGKFTRFVGASLEVFIFRKDKTRVSTFVELETLCAIDFDLAELVATSEKLDLSQKWCDAYIHDSSNLSNLRKTADNSSEEISEEISDVVRGEEKM